MRASFVIVNYNRKDELLKTISKTKELINGNPDYEIVIVDNASIDGSADAVEAAFADVTVIRKAQNMGAPAWNEGFERAKGDYMIIIDDDSHVESGLKDALDYLDRNQQVGVLALNVVSGPYTSEDWEWQDGQDLVGFIGCGAILRKETYQKIGGYADWIFLYVNEWDLGLRAIEAGYQVKYFAKCKVVHRASKINRSSKRLRVFVTRNEMAIVYKYFPKNRWKYLTRIAINSMKGLRQLQLKESWYNLIGIIEFLKMKKTLAYTPVSEKSQQTFLKYFWSTKPAFEFVKRDVSNLYKKVALKKA
ncbi:MAG: glycosyltransferase family 2 protein [Mucilaginibacter sp.]|uniref:glycosyltransferase family 2 protein n=1 Tax=Mucilaginibacter sp. TaxID=1882438 RepID=UPI0034E4A90E